MPADPSADTGFKDHFSGHAESYAAYRPSYPGGLFRWLATLPARRDVAWDAGTGSGQAALSLAEDFALVIATDASGSQLDHATPHPRIDYRIARAEASGLPPRSVDLVTVAQALHWFDLPGFFAEVERVLAPDGAVAVWCYGDPRLADDDLQPIVHRYNRETVEAYWPPERDLVRDEYRAIPFPFAELPAPALDLEARWTLAQLVGYLRSWSATVRYARALGADPLAAVETELGAAWGDPGTTRRISWPLTIRAGRRARSGSGVA